MRNKALLFLTAALLLSIFTLNAAAQRRDNLTDAEDLLVRDAQEIDKRIEIFVKVIDRRFLAIGDQPAADLKKIQKEIDKWGPLRTGTKLEMLSDIEVTLREAIAKIDDVAERDQKNELFPKAVKILAAACQRWIPQLSAMESKAAEEKEKVYLVNAIEYANQVIEATGKLPKEEAKKKKN